MFNCNNPKGWDILSCHQTYDYTFNLQTVIFFDTISDDDNNNHVHYYYKTIL